MEAATSVLTGYLFRFESSIEKKSIRRRSCSSTGNYCSIKTRTAESIRPAKEDPHPAVRETSRKIAPRFPYSDHRWESRNGQCPNSSNLTMRLLQRRRGMYITRHSREKLPHNKALEFQRALMRAGFAFLFSLWNRSPRCLATSVPSNQTTEMHTNASLIRLDRAEKASGPVFFSSRWTMRAMQFFELRKRIIVR